MPFLAVLDLKIHRPSRRLYAATFGRSQYRIDMKASTGIPAQKLETSKLSVYPNPSADQVMISFNLDERATGSLEIYDMAGKLVKSIHKGDFPEGSNEFIWNGSNNASQRIPGTYICRLITNGNNSTNRIILTN